jgi:DNA-binding PadR family transcriptional regulator
MTQTPDPATFVPLKPDFFHILLALSDQDRHGYGMIKAVEEATDGTIVLEPSPLYRRLRRLLEDGIVEEAEPSRDAGHTDERRRYYHLTKLGRQVLACEAARLVELAETDAVRRLAVTGREAG